jgi:hypothetical protein
MRRTGGNAGERAEETRRNQKAGFVTPGCPQAHSPGGAHNFWLRHEIVRLSPKTLIGSPRRADRPFKANLEGEGSTGSTTRPGIFTRLPYKEFMMIDKNDRVSAIEMVSTKVVP